MAQSTVCGISVILLIVSTCVYCTAATAEEERQKSAPVLSRNLLEKINYFNIMTNKTVYEQLFHKKTEGRTEESNKGVPGLQGHNIEDLERSEDAAEVLDNAGCEPADAPITIERSNHRVAAVAPRCVRIKQCGGCCAWDQHECVANTTKAKHVKVVEWEYEASGNGGLVEKERVATLEEHTSCQCQCKLKEHQCNPLIHKYDAEDCQCMCKDTSQKSSCTSLNFKSWNEDTCSCTCDRVISCGSGAVFNNETCLCDAVVARSIQNKYHTAESKISVSAPAADLPISESASDPCAHMRKRKNYVYKLIGQKCIPRFVGRSGRR